MSRINLLKEFTVGELKEFQESLSRNLKLQKQTKE